MPRKPASTPRTAQPSACFNEAGACLPRKRLHRLEVVGCEQAGFNEAGACLPRKHTITSELLEIVLGASMRPGHVCPGNATAARDPADPTPLQ